MKRLLPLPLLLIGFGLLRLVAGLAPDAAPVPPPGRREVLRRIGAVATAAGVAGDQLVPTAAAAGGEDADDADPSRLWLPAGSTGATRLAVPRVGYSLYKTAPEEVAAGVALALRAGVRHFDVATQYGTNAAVGAALADFERRGLLAPAAGEEKYGSAAPVEPSRAARRDALFVTHKVGMGEQFADPRAVMRAVERQRALLRRDALDLCLLHAPLAGGPRRRAAYAALLELQARGRVRAVGVANFGVGPLQELVDAGLPAPTVIQLVLSPFNQHKDVCRWAQAHGSVVCCSAWSKLSSVQGPQEGWATLAGIAKDRGISKAQVLVRWAVQSGYLCVPRSSARYKIDRQAIFENSWQGTRSFVLTDQEMATLNRLDEQLPAGQLGVTDGWEAEDIVDSKWDPTQVV